MMKKMLIVCSTLNLDYPHSATPALWQLFKGLYEEGCELIVVPYRGSHIRSLWWRCYENPCKVEGELYAHIHNFLRKVFSFTNHTSRNGREKLISKLTHIFTKPKWKRLLLNILEEEKNVDAVVFIGVPLNQLTGIATSIKKFFRIPVVYYDLDVPTSLPQFGGFTFNYYVNADVTEYDAIIIPSEGSVPVLKEMGAQKVFVLHFGVDPDVYSPLKLKQDIDITFFGNSSKGRENYIRMMISEPSKILSSSKFLVIGRDIRVDLGNARIIPFVPFSRLRNYCCRSKINLNIARENHAATITSTSRPFELAAMECCVVSAPYRGLDKWFTVGKEMFMVKSVKEAVEIYKWLLQEDDIRKKTGRAARERVLKEHTVRHRARQLVRILKLLESTS